MCIKTTRSFSWGQATLMQHNFPLQPRLGGSCAADYALHCRRQLLGDFPLNRFGRRTEHKAKEPVDPQVPRKGGSLWSRVSYKATSPPVRGMAFPAPEAPRVESFLRLAWSALTTSW